MGSGLFTMNSGLPVISCGISIPISDSTGAQPESRRLRPRLHVFLADINQRHRQVGVGGMRLTGRRIAHSLRVAAVVRGNQQLSTNGLNRFGYLVNAVIQRLPL